jgi:hypothetical protein
MFTELSYTLSETEFIRKSETHLGMFQHMIVVQRRQRIILSMNERTVVPEIRFEYESSRVPCFGSGSVIAARISAFRLDVLDVAILAATLARDFLHGKSGT